MTTRTGRRRNEMGPQDVPDRRADFLDRLRQTEDRQDLAAHEHAVAADAQRLAEAHRLAELAQSQDDRDALRHTVALVGQAAEEWRVAAAELRQLTTEVRQGFRELLEELRRQPGEAS
jgi:hypothetical protein